MEKKTLFSSGISQESKRCTYARMRLLSKIVHGMDERLMQSEMKTLDVNLEISLEDCWILSTGLRRAALNTVEQGRYLYYEVAPTVWAHLCRQIESHGFFGTSFYHEAADDLCLLVSPGKEAGSIDDLAETIEREMQCLMEQYVLQGYRRICVTTAVSEHVSTYGEIEKAFCKVQQLRELEFFHMEPCIMTEEWAGQRKHPCDRLELMEQIVQIERAVVNGEGEEAGTLTEALFCGPVRGAMNKMLCIEMLAELKNRIAALCSVYDMRLEPEMLEKLSVQHCVTIEELAACARKLMEACARQVEAYGKRLHWVTRQAMQFMKRHYMEGIAQRDVADAVGVVPQYLSSVFNRDMNMSIPAYLNALRMEKAKELLLTTDLRVAQVAQMVGVESAGRFYALFKRYTGYTALDFREETKKKREAEKE